MMTIAARIVALVVAASLSLTLDADASPVARHRHRRHLHAWHNPCAGSADHRVTSRLPPADQPADQPADPPADLARKLLQLLQDTHTLLQNAKRRYIEHHFGNNQAHAGGIEALPSIESLQLPSEEDLDGEVNTLQRVYNGLGRVAIFLSKARHHHNQTYAEWNTVRDRHTAAALLDLEHGSGTREGVYVLLCKLFDSLSSRGEAAPALQGLTEDIVPSHLYSEGSHVDNANYRVLTNLDRTFSQVRAALMGIQ